MAGIQKAKSEETQRRVLDAAVKAVEAGGLDAVNIRKIAGSLKGDFIFTTESPAAAFQ